ncbi:hypothetical protein [Flavivirga sp. 57AJ16]|uniref:hypothetical protein n=1 Tax=Flavivirga sp. 57AJ16 TaxID=3025307 RepID=UPI00236648D9|nr:hypothetical protein [Flavivirga sp. 57AJ16]MDD7886135.1 hypothetical protein [Flavivirga sp. 57AJ16]
MKKRNIIILGLFLGAIAFSFPFIIAEENSTLLEIFGTSFKALSAVAGVLTLIIAVILYQKFNIDSILIEEQTHKILELVDLIYDKEAWIGANGRQFISRFTLDDNRIFSEKFYLDMSGMALVIRRKDLDDFIEPIIKICNSYYMPKEIKDSAEFFQFVGLSKGLNNNDSELVKYAKLKYNHTEVDTDVWWKIIHSYNQFSSDVGNPTKWEDAELLVNDYVTNKNLFIQSISDWLSDNSNIKLDHNFDIKQSTGVVSKIISHKEEEG